MKWYKDGTVAITNASKTVTGAGTSFITIAGVTPGDAFTVDDSQFYEIEAVVSETELTLVKAFAGATQSNTPFGIDRRSSNSLSNDALAARVATRFTEWQQFVDQVNAWKAGTIDGGPNSDGKYPLTDPLGEEHLTASPAKVNDIFATDLTKLTGIEANATADQTATEILTAIKTVDGAGSGLDADLLDGHNSSYFYNQGNILGTVSQTAGIPTGAIIERGSNDDGEYVKFADGTLICTGTCILPVQSLHTNVSVILPWAFKFVATPMFSYSLVEASIGTGAANGAYLVYGNGLFSADTNFSIFVLTSYSYNYATIFPNSFSVLAIGRWF